MTITTGTRLGVDEIAAPRARWRADGKELYFLEADTPVPLFRTRIVGGGAVTNNRPQYAVARDGRFLINQTLVNASAAPITLILNWNPDAKKERSPSLSA